MLVTCQRFGVFFWLVWQTKYNKGILRIKGVFFAVIKTDIKIGNV